jgi:hypothetical protein
VVCANGLWKAKRRSFEPVEFRDANVPLYELRSRGIEMREPPEVAIGRIMTRKELGCA